jgi:SpoVK/Ycf46/Vps4 family AAA+-type ATPase
MATRELRRLFEAIARQDWANASSLASGIAKSEAERGNHTAARTLEDALSTRGTSFAVPASMVNLGLMKMASNARLADVTLASNAREQLTRLVSEHRHADQLLKAGFEVRRTLIFSGPPGSGKTLTAKALASELDLPLFVVRIDAIVGSYLGQTAANLRQLFQFAEHTSCVLLFDELDALGKSRGSGMDVGELDRIVIALMQELELARPLGIVIATSNLPEAIDRALWRRFDLHIEYPKASKEQLRAFSKRVANKYESRPPLSLLEAAERSKSFAEAEKVVIDHYRMKLLLKIGEPNGS